MVDRRFPLEEIRFSKDVPKKVRAIASFPIEAVLLRNIGSADTWLAEIKVAEMQRIGISLRRLAEMDRLVEKYKTQLENCRLDIESKDESIKILRKKTLDLERNVAQLMKNIEDPSLRGGGARSPKNYLAVAMERGTNFGSPAFQGGDGGLEKK